MPLQRSTALLSITIALASLFTAQSHATVYYLAASGSDENPGTSPDAPWKTLSRANTTVFLPGDRILLRRGDTWRGQIIPAASGAEGAPILYGAYGEGEKPLILGSVQKNRPEDWVDLGGNIWSTTNPAATGSEVLTPAMRFHTEGQARAQLTANPRGFTVTCSSSGEAPSEIQAFTQRFPVNAGALYKLVFATKTTLPFDMPPPRLFKDGPPWSSYEEQRNVAPLHNEGERRFELYYRSTIAAPDARIGFMLGQAMPPGAAFEVFDMSLVECLGDGFLDRDVGNIIFDNEKSCGLKVWEKADLDKQDEYWYDEDARVVCVYSTANPAVVHANIECALRRHLIDQTNRSHLIYENLTLKYGAAHGVGGANTHHITVRDCDFGYIGGGDQMGGDKTVRFGNGVEFWANGHDCLVERCRLWEIYDAALTNQSSGPRTKHYNIVYRNNVIWNCEYSFEYWNRPEDSETYDVVFENNTCVNAGHGWGHAQRPDPNGRHLCFYSNPAQTRNLIVRNNIFYESTTVGLYLRGWTDAGRAGLTLENNCWYQETGPLILMEDTNYTMAQFAGYQTATGKDAQSITANPLFRDLAAHDFRLTQGSPCIAAGKDTDVKTDFDGKPREGKMNIGAFAFTP
ncbi:MAG: hypothetical protein K1Y02_03925 [Candidatus Hydrogenedentes bacterium]|nr:hypothetical protein [Candidatus Hydrogenedentota bacterium]